MIQDRTDKALKQINAITEKAVGGYTDDVAKMAQQLVRDSTGPKATGQMASRIRAEHRDGHAVVGDARNDDGHGYTAAVDWGHTRKGGTRIKGKRAIIRATFGMMKRWARGERWRD